MFVQPSPGHLQFNEIVMSSDSLRFAAVTSYNTVDIVNKQLWDISWLRPASGYPCGIFKYFI
jgi:hypothetical protein